MTSVVNMREWTDMRQEKKSSSDLDALGLMVKIEDSQPQRWYT